VRLRGVFVQPGDLNVEKVQILSDGPSAFRAMFAPGAPPGGKRVFRSGNLGGQCGREVGVDAS
jgi:hypothetical protein